MNCEDDICWKTNKMGWKAWNVPVFSRKEGWKPGKIYCLVLFISLQQLLSWDMMRNWKRKKYSSSNSIWNELGNTCVTVIFFFFLLELEMYCLSLFAILRWNKQPHPYVLQKKFPKIKLISPAFLEFCILSPFTNYFVAFSLLPYAGSTLISLVKLLHSFESLHFPGLLIALLPLLVSVFYQLPLFPAFLQLLCKKFWSGNYTFLIGHGQ